MVVAAISPQQAWRQPILRLIDTIVGIAVGIAGAWIGLKLATRIPNRASAGVADQVQGERLDLQNDDRDSQSVGQHARERYSCAWALSGNVIAPQRAGNVDSDSAAKRLLNESVVRRLNLC